MDNIHRLHVVNSLGHLPEYGFSVFLWQTSLLAFLGDSLDEVVEFLPLEVLQQQVNIGLVFKEVIKFDDLRTIQLPVHLDLMVNAVLDVLRFQDLFIDNFERKGRFGCPTAHLVYDRGGPTSELSHDLVVGESTAELI